METSVPRRRRSPIPIVIATVFVDIVGFAMILPLLPSYAARLGGTPTSIGLLVASYSLLQLVLAPLWGRASDRFGRRSVLLIGLTGSVVSYLLFAVAGSYAMLLLSRVIDGASGASINVAQAYLADETRSTQRARAMGIVGAAVGVGFIVGPILGGITAGISPMLPGLLAAAITAINLLVAVVILPESRQRRRAAVPKATIPLSWGTLLPAMSVIFLATLAFSVMYVVFPLFGEQRLGATRSTVSYWFAFVGLVTAIVQGGLLGRLVRWLGEPGTARLGAALLAGGFLLVAPSVRGGETTWVFFAALASLGAGFGMAGAAMTGLVSRRTGADRQGRVLGITQSASAMARIVGPISAGAIMQAKSAEGAFLASAVMAAIALAIAAGLGRRPPVAVPTPAS
jgi:MFS transporter, DHA1 family, tetracycline resistance protein